MVQEIELKVILRMQMDSKEFEESMGRCWTEDDAADAAKILTDNAMKHFEDSGFIHPHNDLTSTTLHSVDVLSVATLEEASPQPAEPYLVICEDGESNIVFSAGYESLEDAEFHFGLFEKQVQAIGLMTEPVSLVTNELRVVNIRNDDEELVSQLYLVENK